MAQESLMQSVGSAIHRFFERRRIEKTRTELLTLDDHALADIGIARSKLEAREDPLMANGDRRGIRDEPARPPRTH